jgi:hypothetical protein
MHFGSYALTLIAGVLLGAVLVVAVQLGTGPMYRYYSYAALGRNFDRVIAAEAQGCAPMADQQITIRCPFWITP